MSIERITVDDLKRNGFRKVRGVYVNVCARGRLSCVWQKTGTIQFNLDDVPLVESLNPSNAENLRRLVNRLA